MQTVKARTDCSGTSTYARYKQLFHVLQVFSPSLPRHAMMSTVWTLVLVALAAIMTSGAQASAMLGGPGVCGLAGGLGVTWFISVKCTETGQLSSHCLFLNRASVRRHIARSKPCFQAQLGFHEIHIQARAGYVMAGGGGWAGPAQSIRHQPPGARTRSLTETDNIYTNIIPNFHLH
jgi:hypothetical protein